jgi:uncharacterized protein
MHVEIGDTENSYFSSRGRRVEARVRIRKDEAIPEQSPLDIFLTARFRLYSLLSRRLITGKVEHLAWELNRAAVLELDENVRAAVGLQFPSDFFVVHHSRGVDTRIGFPRKA